ncbi:hypothetical protein ABVC73_05745 [Prevotella melaninogenica]
MMNQKEMDDIFITTLESIVQVCDLTTSGNISHYIATIKCKCRDMLQFYKENLASPWHSVADGDLPLKAKNNNRVEFSIEVLVRLDKNRLAFGCYDYTYKGWYVGLQRVYPTHWIDIPDLPTE